MKLLFAVKWWAVLPAYLVGGLVLGLADPLLGRTVQQLGVRPGLATAASVNLLLPLLAVGLGLLSPRLRTVWPGALSMSAAYVLGLALVYPPAPGWGLTTLARAVPPVLVLACLGYLFLGTLTALVTRAVWK
jgi:hypothetical protein